MTAEMAETTPDTAEETSAEDAAAATASPALGSSPAEVDEEYRKQRWSRFVGEAVLAEERLARELTGIVVSSKADKTITVRVDRRVKHPVYGKFIRRSTKLAAHDPGNDCREGDTVTIIETRPVSKTKSWRLGAIVERAGE